MELLERKRIIEEILKEGRNAEVEEVTVTAGGGVTRKAIAGSQKQWVISLRQKREFVRRVKEQMKQLPLEQSKLRNGG